MAFILSAPQLGQCLGLLCVPSKNKIVAVILIQKKRSYESRDLYWYLFMVYQIWWGNNFKRIYISWKIKIHMCCMINGQ